MPEIWGELGVWSEAFHVLLCYIEWGKLKAAREEARNRRYRNFKEAKVLCPLKSVGKAEAAGFSARVAVRCVRER